MISARIFAEQTSIWTSVAPTLDRVARWCNGGLLPLGNAVPALSRQERRALIAETAFQMVASGYRDVASAATGMAEERARAFVTTLNSSPSQHELLSSEEWGEVGGLALVSYRYLDKLTAPVYSPLVSGCGVVDTAYADVLDGEHLIEVKAVSRGVRTGDLRQLLTYAAMLYATGVTIDHITWLNPRRARYWTHPLSAIAYGASGAPAAGFLQDIVNLMMELQVSA